MRPDNPAVSLCRRKEGNMDNTATKARTQLSVKQLSLAGLMTAIICILAPFALPIPVSPVQISLGTLAIYFVLTVLGLKLGTISVVVYILLGLAGLPVFAGFTGGAGKLLGPSGGFILGYIFMALICGFFIDKWGNNIFFSFLGFLLGTAVLYLFGSLWLIYQTSVTLSQAILAYAVPYIPADLIKLILAMSLGRQVRKRLEKAELI